jgi:hypothetical protein
MESVWLLLGGGSPFSLPIRFGFLGTSPFRCETPDYEGWFCLDFLGFSRPNLDFSMAYTDNREKDFSSRFHLTKEPSKRLAMIWHTEGTDCTWGKPTSISDFLQDIAARVVPA